jgi:3-oxoacid CoA-transferase subunit A
MPHREWPGFVEDGMTIMADGFGLCGIPQAMINALRDSRAKILTFISNNAGVDGIGLGRLLERRQTSKMISSSPVQTLAYLHHLGRR